MLKENFQESINMETKTRIRSNEILIAIIGLIGVLVTAGLSNWDKIFPESNVIEAEYSGYRPTDNYETELRYFFNVSGTRLIITNMQSQLARTLKMQLSMQHPEESKMISTMLDIALEEAVTLDEVIKQLLPIYKNHFTLAEIQELNKFYSTEAMQNMTKKLPLLAQETAPIQVEMLTKSQQRFLERITKEMD